MSQTEELPSEGGDEMTEGDVRQRGRGPERPDRAESGAVVIEFAMVLPILVILVFGIVQFGLLFHRQHGIHSAAREGARLAALSDATSEDIVARVDEDLSDIPIPEGRTVVITAPAPYGSRSFADGVAADTESPCEGNFGEPVTVVIETETTLEVPMWGTRTVGVTGTGEFRCE